MLALKLGYVLYAGFALLTSIYAVDVVDYFIMPIGKKGPKTVAHYNQPSRSLLVEVIRFTPQRGLKSYRQPTGWLPCLCQDTKSYTETSWCVKPGRKYQFQFNVM